MATTRTPGPILEHDRRDEIAERYLAAWNAHDADAVAAFFAPDAVYDDRGAAQVADGRDAILAHVRAVVGAFPDLRFELIRLAHGADFTCAEWTCRMTHLGDLSGLAPTGRGLTTAGVDVATLEPDGAITHLVSYYDGAAIMRALGLLPERGSRVERVLTRAASIAGRFRRS
jgi:C-1 hydroxylase